LKHQKGFSLIELLIVVAIILVISAIAIPNLVRSRMTANEASAVASVRAINTAQIGYITSYPTVGFADNLTKLAAPIGGGPVNANNAGLLDWVLGCASQPCAKSGYNFAIVNAVGAPVNTYDVTSTPTVPGSTGNRGFCSNQGMVIRFDPVGGTNCATQIQ